MLKLARKFYRGFTMLFCSSYMVDYDHARREALMLSMKVAHDKLMRSDADNLAADWSNVGSYLFSAMDIAQADSRGIFLSRGIFPRRKRYGQCTNGNGSY